MNLLQLYLLKLNEECQEVSYELLKEPISIACGFSNSREICDEINDLCAVIRLLNENFDFQYELVFHQHKTLLHLNMRDCIAGTLKCCSEVAKLASKCIQFGLMETQEGLKLNNKERLHLRLNDLFIRIGYLNKLGLGFYLDEEHSSKKIDKILRYATYSSSLSCVDMKDVPVDQYQIVNQTSG